jgi:Ala-tRNA(Pro) deacylase
MTDAETQLYADLAALGIRVTTYEHPAVFTVAESSALDADIPGAHTKNLFLKDKKGRFWLVTVRAELRVNLKMLPEAIGCDRVSFGNPEDMQRLLGVTPGSVTALAVRNDTENHVQIVLDEALLAADIVNCHPLRNDATLSIAPTDLVRALQHWNHKPIIAPIPISEIQ